jgi:hypothetical protein
VFLKKKRERRGEGEEGRRRKKEEEEEEEKKRKEKRRKENQRLLFDPAEVRITDAEFISASATRGRPWQGPRGSAACRAVVDSPGVGETESSNAGSSSPHPTSRDQENRIKIMDFLIENILCTCSANTLRTPKS